jgi:hypothetical protein
MRRREPYDRDGLHFAPFVLFPSPFPREEFHKAVQLQTVLNELMHKVPTQHSFLFMERLCSDPINLLGLLSVFFSHR